MTPPPLTRGKHREAIEFVSRDEESCLLISRYVQYTPGVFVPSRVPSYGLELYVCDYGILRTVVIMMDCIYSLQAHSITTIALVDSHAIGINLQHIQRCDVGQVALKG